MPKKTTEELVALDTIELAEDQALLGDFPGEVDGQPALVTAVLERTVVVQLPGQVEKVLMRKGLVKARRSDLNIVTVRPRQGVGRPRGSTAPAPPAGDPPAPAPGGGEEPAA
ncbi:MAG: hypothetical protein ACYDAY_03825 [Candidatus Dormibacteria bacterium]